MREIKTLKKMGACRDGVNWLKTQPDFQTAWQVCQRGDWMLWLLTQLAGPVEPSDDWKKLQACYYTFASVRNAPGYTDIYANNLVVLADIIRVSYCRHPVIQ